MATQTTYYEFNKPGGTDLVNPLTDTNPNWDLADNALHELNERSVANATETVVLGVHAISRLNTDTKLIRWIATANFEAGDTFTVDGVAVAASTPAGSTLSDDAYVSGSIVLASLNSDNTAMTIYVSGTNVATDSAKLGGELPAYYAKQSDMDSAELDIDNIQALNGNTSIASIGDGTLTGAVSTINQNLTDVSDEVETLKSKQLKCIMYGVLSASGYVDLPEEIPVTDYVVFLDMDCNSNGVCGGVYLSEKTSTRFKVTSQYWSNGKCSYQVLKLV